MTYAQAFRDFIAALPPDKSKDSTVHSGSHKVHHGLSNPTMRGFVKQWAGEHPNLTYSEWESTLSDLYRGESIDEVCLAGFMLGRYKSFRNQLPLATLDTWIAYLEGWREIDTTCQSNYTASDVLERWEIWQPFLSDLAQRETIQHRRASLVLLIKPVRDSEDEQLISTALANVEQVKHETDKLITKAVSWILRESIKRHREIVEAYVANNAETLPKIAVREFQKKFETGKK